jgi:hypothetical protein
MKRTEQPRKKTSWGKVILVTILIIGVIQALKKDGHGFKFDLEV